MASFLKVWWGLGWGQTHQNILTKTSGEGGKYNFSKSLNSISVGGGPREGGGAYCNYNFNSLQFHSFTVDFPPFILISYMLPKSLGEGATS